MQYIIKIVLFVSTFTLISTSSIGRVFNARLLPGLRNSTLWLFNQSDVNTCLCRALQLYSWQQIAALNSFTYNSTFQLILSPPVLAPNLIYDINSILILLHPLTDAPCCSDLSWLLTRIQKSQKPSSDSVPLPTSLSINSYNTLLSTLSYYGSLVRFYRNNLSLAGDYPLPTNYLCDIVSYRQGRFFLGCDIPSALVILDESNLTSPMKLINTTAYTSAVAFVRNDTMMFVRVQYLNTSIIVYDINLTTNSYIPLNQTYPVTSLHGLSMNAINDSLILLSNWDPNVYVYALTPSSNKSSDPWSMFPLNATQISSTERIAEQIIDSCASWTVFTTLDGILLLDTYELFLSDYDGNKILHFNPNLQCT
ncbi:hypothetical protein I4U23_004563 [Adineta vaga]|nr:hypothetical protein I4U23_004563 [Adineta vaga]